MVRNGGRETLMGMTPFAQPAVAPQPAAVAPDPQNLVPGAAVPIPATQGAPGSAPTPDPSVQTQTAPVAPPVVQLTPEEHRRLLEADQRNQQIVSELQQLAAANQAEQARQKRDSETKTRLDAARVTASAMTPEDAFNYMQRAAEGELVRVQQELERERQAERAQMMLAFENISAPMYARELAQKHGLSSSYEQQLAALPVRQMDSYVPSLKAAQERDKSLEQKYAEVVNQLDQLRRTGQANVLGTNGVHTPAPLGGPAPSSDANGAAPGSIEQLLSIPGAARVLGYQVVP